jgi:hypothetical protein
MYGSPARQHRGRGGRGGGNDVQLRSENEMCFLNATNCLAWLSEGLDHQFSSQPNIALGL